MPREGIAIVGLACLFPGADTPAAFWQNLLAERDCTSDASAELGVDPELLFDARRGQPDKTYWLRGGYVRGFDGSGLDLPAGLDDPALWSLYTAREALRDAGLGADPEPAGRCGLVLGHLSFPTKASHRTYSDIYATSAEAALRELLDEPDLRLPRLNERSPLPLRDALLGSSPAAAVADALGLRGPAFCLDAACASSLYAIKLAGEYLLSGETNVMLAGAVSCADPLFVTMGFALFQAYPEAGGASRPLDRSTGGLVSGEGAGVFVLKRERDALRDGNRIYGVVRGVGLSSDGRGKHLLTPSTKGQTLAMRRAYDTAGISPSEVDYVECHATGTPLGDGVELESMSAVFGDDLPPVGSVKSNLGHLLTAAGMAGVTKVVLGMAAGLVPATINVNEPITASVVRESRAWPRRGSARRAAVSAFGFGGVNAHLVLEGPESAGKSEPSEPAARTRLAITGLGARFGACRDVRSLSRALFDGVRQFQTGPNSRWKGLQAQPGRTIDARGSYVEDLELEFLRFGIPPRAGDEPIPQQLLLLAAADEAIRDANLAAGSNVAVLTAMGTELELHRYRGRVDLGWQLAAGLAQVGIALAQDELENLQAIARDSLLEAPSVNKYVSFIGNIMASRVAAQWDFSGPAFTVSAGDVSAFQALDLAQLLLSRGEVEAVVVAGVDLAGSLESVMLRGQRVAVAAAPSTMSHDRHEAGWPVGEGAGALVLVRASEAGPRIYATVEGLGIERGEPQEGLDRAARAALEAAGVERTEVEYLELNASGLAEEDRAETAALTTVYRSDGAPAFAAGSAKSLLGHTHAAAGIAGLVRTALCLYEGYVPCTPGWTAPKELAAWTQAGWYVPAESKPWLVGPRSRRLAAVSGLGDGAAAHAILASSEAERPQVSAYLREGPARLFLAGGHDEASLLESFDELERRAGEGLSLSELGRSSAAGVAAAPLKVALVAGSGQELTREIERARAALPAAVRNSGEWSTPAGSYFSAAPLAGGSSLAFVYSGGISSYLGLGRRLVRAFPYLSSRLSELADDPAEILGERLLYPRSATAIPAEDLPAHQARLVEDAFAVASSSSAFSLQTTLLLREVFGVEPKTAFGFSLGEASMMIALGVWPGPAVVRQALAAAPAMRPRLCGPKQAVRDFWNVAADVPDDQLWSSHVVLASPAEVQQALAGEDRAFLAIVAAPREVFVTGDPAACGRVIDRLDTASTPAPFNYVLHCPVAKSEMDALASMYRLDVASRPPIRFHSAAAYGPVRLETETIAQSIAATVGQPLDFPRLIRRAYDDGARLFVELGPGNSCARWIRATLGDQPHLALSVDQKGLDERVSIVRALAKLVSHGVAVNLEPLFEEAALEAGRQRHVQRVVLGGPPLHDMVVTEEHIRRFRRPRPAAQGGPPQAARPAMATDLEPGPPARPARAASVTGWPDSTAQPMAASGASREAATAPVLAAAEARPLAMSPNPGGPQTYVQSLFLRNRHDAALAMGALLTRQIELIRSSVQAPPATLPAPAAPPAIWDEAALREFAGGSIAKVFGAEYAVIDGYSRRVRLPRPPYLLVSRVTRLDARRGVFEPSRITTEYDIPFNSWYSLDGQIPWAVAVESGQCDLLLISYLGIDFENRGERVYRLLDCALTFREPVPMEGETLRYDISINSFARSGDNLLFFFSYDCYVGNTLILQMDGGCAGFFSDEELRQGKGVVFSEAELDERRAISPRTFRPLLTCGWRQFDADHLEQLRQGRLEAVFSAAHDKHGRNPSLRLPPGEISMLDRITEVDPDGGPWGLGTLVAEKDLAPSDWYFPCHFQDDQVLAGSLMAEGCVQLLQFYLLYMGFHTRTRNARFQPVAGLRQVVRCRGQVTPEHRLLTYRMEITDVGLTPEPYATANIEIWVDGRMVVHFKDLGVRLVDDGHMPAPASPASTTFDERQIEEFATGSFAACFGTDFAIYDGKVAPRQPNGDLKLISRVVSVNGRRGDFNSDSTIVTEYDVPANPWFCTDAGTPDTAYAVLMELGLQPCGFLSAFLGSTLPFPEEELHFRNLDGSGELLSRPDLRGKTVRNGVRLLSSVAMQGIIIQKFAYELSVDGAPFFRGDAAFGYFNSEALDNQVGLDGGSAAPSWLEEHPTGARQLDSIALFERRAEQPHYHLPRGHFDLLDSFTVVDRGGRHEQGYVYAERQVNPFDWFFANHFYQDPVMPGSLGVEAMVEALRAYSLDLGLGGRMRSPRFTQAAPHATVWKYRGQIVPSHRRMSLELHVKSVTEYDAGVLLVADGSLWRDNLRIYEVTDLAVQIEEGS